MVDLFRMVRSLLFLSLLPRREEFSRLLTLDMCVTCLWVSWVWHSSCRASFCQSPCILGLTLKCITRIILPFCAIALHQKKSQQDRALSGETSRTTVSLGCLEGQHLVFIEQEWETLICCCKLMRFLCLYLLHICYYMLIPANICHLCFFTKWFE